ncbi:MAG: DUF4249 domain-containing protein [Saprospiraceae bacterium]|nr:DUF4249 domain-containing protein [Saprospiraceae bacterium]
MKKLLFLLFAAPMLFTSCEEPYTPPTTEEDQQYVVEGYVEYGEGSLPTYVMLTKSLPYITTIGPDQLANLFVKDANVTVYDGTKEVKLTQLCLNQLPEELRAAALAILGLEADSTTLNICLYVDVLNQIEKKEGGKYDLTVDISGYKLNASTTIPRHVPLFDARFEEPPGEPSDTLAALWFKIKDPTGPDYYRYLTTGDEDDRFIAPFQSTIDDAFFESKQFDFPLNKAERRGGGADDADDFGLFVRGDSVSVKWMCMDKAHFDFWRTRDFAANSGGPFSSYTRIKTNIEGGLGIWGGYSVSYYRLFCPPK